MYAICARSCESRAHRGLIKVHVGHRWLVQVAFQFSFSDSVHSNAVFQHLFHCVDDSTPVIERFMVKVILLFLVSSTASSIPRSIVGHASFFFLRSESELCRSIRGSDALVLIRQFMENFTSSGVFQFFLSAPRLCHHSDCLHPQWHQRSLFAGGVTVLSSLALEPIDHCRPDMRHGSKRIVEGLWNHSLQVNWFVEIKQTFSDSLRRNLSTLT